TIPPPNRTCLYWRRPSFRRFWRPNRGTSLLWNGWARWNSFDGTRLRVSNSSERQTFFSKNPSIWTRKIRIDTIGSARLILFLLLWEREHQRRRSQSFWIRASSTPERLWTWIRSLLTPWIISVFSTGYRPSTPKSA